MRNRQSQAEALGASSFLCRLDCGYEESMAHLPCCPKMRPFWDNIFDFLKEAGEPAPESQPVAIVFNL